MLNSHCYNNDRKKIIKSNKIKKIMRSPRFETRIYGFKDHRGIHYAMETNEIIDENNQYMLKL